MNAVGIDVSKGKSMVTVMRSLSEVVLPPFEVPHTDSELSELAKTLKNLPGETRVVMEYTGYYHAPVALALCEAGLYVSVAIPCWCMTTGTTLSGGPRRTRRTP